MCDSIPHPTAIVISSSWRYTYSCDHLSGILGRNGIKQAVIGFTPTANAYEDRSRGKEINQYLHSFRKRVVLDSYVVIDDDMHDILTEIPSKNIVYCDHFVGFTEADSERAKQILTMTDYL